MKKTLLIAVLTLSFAACKKEIEKPAPPVDNRCGIVVSIISRTGILGISPTIIGGEQYSQTLKVLKNGEERIRTTTTGQYSVGEKFCE